MIRGLDIYHEDDVTSWKELVAGGMEFVYIKATEGLHYRDLSFANNMKAAGDVGMIRGAYHFLHLDLDPVAQADRFCSYIKACGGLEAEDFVVLDWETQSGDPYDIDQDPHTVKAFLNEVASVLKKKCFIYVGYYMVNAVNNPLFLKEYPLILPWYAPESQIKAPLPWTKWNIWQSSGMAKIRGLGNPGDLDVFNGSKADLKNLIMSCNL